MVEKISFLTKKRNVRKKSKKEITKGKWTTKKLNKRTYVSFYDKPKTKKKTELKEELKKYIQKMYGKKCKDFAIGCPCCLAWALYDYLFIWEWGS